MKRRPLTSFIVALAFGGAVIGAVSAPVHATDAANDREVLIQTSVFTKHFNPRPEHTNDQRMLNVERYQSSFLTNSLQRRWRALHAATPFWGLSSFRNSYDQGSTYAYGGFLFSHYQRPHVELYSKVTYGLIHGYRDRYDHRIPLNYLGIAPAIIPMAGIRAGKLHGEITLFGDSGFMLTAGFTF